MTAPVRLYVIRVGRRLLRLTADELVALPAAPALEQEIARIGLDHELGRIEDARDLPTVTARSK